MHEMHSIVARAQTLTPNEPGRQCTTRRLGTPNERGGVLMSKNP
jgi:hypothetical protein